ncbi:hypothetical protein B0H14DRAFT_3173190 [Mycena olivaceomarginata]|nr:hypothetical protein B0H14DRAFT_3173190 [Mycena olivaceomarginata]
MSGNSNRRLEISEIRASCDEPRKLRVVVSVKPNPPRDKVTQLREAKSELKTTELSVLIPPSSGVENGKLLVVQVYEIRRRWLDKQLLNEEFSFEALGTYCAGESEFKVYPILRQGDITIHANLKVTNVDDLLPSKSITGTILVSPVLPSAPVAASTISKVDCDSSVASNLSAALTLVQQVGDLMGSIPLMKPIAEILKQFVEVYKKVEDNYGKRDSLVEKVAVLARDIAGAMNLLNERGDVDWNTRLKSDLDEYMALLKEVRDSIIAFDDRRGPIRVLKREELGEAFDSLDQKITFFGNRFGASTPILFNAPTHLTTTTRTNVQ